MGIYTLNFESRNKHVPEIEQNLNRKIELRAFAYFLPFQIFLPSLKQRWFITSKIEIMYKYMREETLHSSHKHQAQ